jgi:hypothetical protein
MAARTAAGRPHGEADSREADSREDRAKIRADREGLTSGACGNATVDGTSTRGILRGAAGQSKDQEGPVIWPRWCYARRMKDAGLFQHINELAEEEERLFARAGDGSGLSPIEIERLDEIRVELDQGYDLLHQRQARRAAGLDPAEAEVRSPEIVERYKQ